MFKEGHTNKMHENSLNAIKGVCNEGLANKAQCGDELMGQSKIPMGITITDSEMSDCFGVALADTFLYHYERRYFVSRKGCPAKRAGVVDPSLKCCQCAAVVYPLHAADIEPRIHGNGQFD
ncbi:hypothetical protein THAOC_33962 [Thalassiosira oceanica]|uniref:Uncharacterized protein n=1 Tax=Thalassiosira oceanica TaxID=159749 RepID=K0R4A2_THAOC|nr:hypothetical protein THAOC_33962 [Thalassiosira oceanica]|eukprot:EJK47325.1 hypothetical protein THAOC_33962 [Thalassiosira oceanica]